MTMVTAERRAAVRHAHRAAGQVAALAVMIESGPLFADVVQQLLAARASLDSLLLRLAELELETWVPNSRARDEIDGLLRSALWRSGPSRHAARSRSRRLQANAAFPDILLGGPSA